MDYVKEIPAGKRWAIATRSATAFPFAYDKAFRELAGDEMSGAIDRIERRIWKEAGEEQAVFARELRCPRNNAANVAYTFSALSTAILGPDLQGYVGEGEGDTARVITTSCPMEKNGRIFQADMDRVCKDCYTYTSAAVKSLNPAYRVRHEKTMCTGDSTCEMCIEPREPR